MNQLLIGDNLHLLKEIPDASIDHIYTDPPYLSNNKSLTYSDTMTELDWLSFMHKRLLEMHRILKPTGTLLIHIDERMQVELNQILFNIFKKKNKIVQFIWRKKTTASNQSKFATIEHEYIIAYAKDIKKCKWNHIPIEKEYMQNVPELSYRPLKLDHPIEKHPGGVYPIYIDNVHISLSPFPDAIEILPQNGKQPGCWRFIPSTCQKFIDADMLMIKNNKIYVKQYANFKFDKSTGTLIPFVRTNPIRSIILSPTNLNSNKEIKAIFNRTAFTYSKPIDLVKSLITLISNPLDTILDPFAGSGTTGQAAFELNRKFLLMQLDENNIPSLIQERLNKTIGKVNYVVI